MDGRAFLGSAQRLLTAPNEANWRSAAGRLYIAMLQEAKEALGRWGFPLSAQDDIHLFVLSRFGSAPNFDLLRVEDVLKRLGQFSRDADYFLGSPGAFLDAREVSHMQALAQVGIDLLDQIEADAARRTAAIVNIRTVWP